MSEPSWEPSTPDFTPRPPGGWIDPDLPPVTAPARTNRHRVGLSAGFFIRAVALLVDSVILFVPVYLLIEASGGLPPDGGRLGVPTSTRLAITGIGLAYYASLEGRGATIGKALVGIRVVDSVTGRPGIGVGRGLIRYLARIPSGLFCGLGYLAMLVDRRRRTWHDSLSGTKVVRW